MTDVGSPFLLALERQIPTGVVGPSQGEFVDNDINGNGVYKWVGVNPVASWFHGDGIP